MSTPLLKNYGFQNTSEDEFEFDFEIPTNCNFTTQYDPVKKTNTVSVQLNSGQTQPSTTYDTQYTTLYTVNGILDVRFQETLNGTTTKRPKISIDSNAY